MGGACRSAVDAHNSTRARDRATEAKDRTAMEFGAGEGIPTLDPNLSKAIYSVAGNGKASCFEKLGELGEARMYRRPAQKSPHVRPRLSAIEKASIGPIDRR